MKKIIRIIATSLTAILISLAPVSVLAQGVDGDAIPVDALPSTGASEVKAPDTGIAPTENKALQNAVIFAGGSTIGAALGFGIISLRKKSDS